MHDIELKQKAAQSTTVGRQKDGENAEGEQARERENNQQSIFFKLIYEAQCGGIMHGSIRNHSHQPKDSAYTMCVHYDTAQAKWFWCGKNNKAIWTGITVINSQFIIILFRKAPTAFIQWSACVCVCVVCFFLSLLIVCSEEKISTPWDNKSP